MESIESILERLGRSGNLRNIPPDSRGDGLVDFTSNDYLGLAADSSLQDEFFAKLGDDRPSLTSSASRLLASDQIYYQRLEETLARLYGRTALLFNSGYHANTGLIAALAPAGTLIVADKLVHASIIDGYKLSGADLARFRHNDMNHLESIVRSKSDAYGRILVVTESVYSMDGDSPDINALLSIKSRYPSVMLYVDEAHAFAVSGPGGLGLSMASENPSGIDVLVGTFGKASASVGAFAVMSDTLRSFAVNNARSLIFSTAIPPLNAEWTRFVVERLSMLEERRRHLRILAARLHEGLMELIPAGSKLIPAESHIQYIVTGSADRAVALSQALKRRGQKVLPIRTPTVPPGTERLRISLSAAMTMEDIDSLIDSLRNEI